MIFRCVPCLSDSGVAYVATGRLAQANKVVLAPAIDWGLPWGL